MTNKKFISEINKLTDNYFNYWAINNFNIKSIKNNRIHKIIMDDEKQYNDLIKYKIKEIVIIDNYRGIKSPDLWIFDFLQDLVNKKFNIYYTIDTKLTLPQKGKPVVSYGYIIECKELKIMTGKDFNAGDNHRNFLLDYYLEFIKFILDIKKYKNPKSPII